jgi:tellurite resistance protein
LSEIDFKQEIFQVQNPMHSMHELLKSVTPSLNDHGKEMVIKAAFLVASADRNFDDEEKRLLAETATALEMSSSHLNAVIQEMV